MECKLCKKIFHQFEVSVYCPDCLKNLLTSRETIQERKALFQKVSVSLLSNPNFSEYSNENLIGRIEQETEAILKASEDFATKGDK